MKWKIRLKVPTTPTPKLGDKRVITKYAWLPRKIDYGTERTCWIWLDMYFQEQVYTEIAVGIQGLGVFPENRWIETRNYY